MPISNVTKEDNMIMMARYPDNYFDLAIVDPPYGIGMDGGKIGFQGKMVFNGKRQSVNSPTLQVKAKIFEKKSWDIKKPDNNYFIELMRVSKNQIIWGGNYFIRNLFDTSCLIVWDKENGESNFADCEIAWTSFNTAIRKFTFRWHGFFQEEMSPKKRETKIHPTQKPAKLYNWILQNYASKGDKILDTHLGSGSSRIAAYKLGFDFWGCEIDKDYFEAQEKRFKEAINEPLFQTQPERIQAKLL